MFISILKTIKIQILIFVKNDNPFNCLYIFAINKIDLPTAQVKMCQDMICNQFGIKVEDISLVSARSGVGVPALLEKVIANVPAPYENNNEPLRALVFDSYYDKYRGVICFVRVRNGQLKTKQ